MVSLSYVHFIAKITEWILMKYGIRDVHYKVQENFISFLISQIQTLLYMELKLSLVACSSQLTCLHMYKRPGSCCTI